MKSVSLIALQHVVLLNEHMRHLVCDVNGERCMYAQGVSTHLKCSLLNFVVLPESS